MRAQLEAKMIAQITVTTELQISIRITWHPERRVLYLEIWMPGSLLVPIVCYWEVQKSELVVQFFPAESRLEIRNTSVSQRFIYLLPLFPLMHLIACLTVFLFGLAVPCLLLAALCPPVCLIAASQLVSLSVRLSAILPNHLPVGLSVCLPAWLSTCLPVWNWMWCLLFTSTVVEGPDSGQLSFTVGYQGQEMKIAGRMWMTSTATGEGSSQCNYKQKGISKAIVF